MIRQATDVPDRKDVLINQEEIPTTLCSAFVSSKDDDYTESELNSNDAQLFTNDIESRRISRENEETDTLQAKIESEIMNITAVLTSEADHEFTQNEHKLDQSDLKCSKSPEHIANVSNLSIIDSISINKYNCDQCESLNDATNITNDGNTSSVTDNNETLRNAREPAWDQHGAESLPDAEESTEIISADAKGYGFTATPYLDVPLNNECWGDFCVEVINGANEQVCVNKCGNHDQMLLYEDELASIELDSHTNEGDTDMGKLLFELGQLFEAVCDDTHNSKGSCTDIPNFVLSGSTDNLKALYRNENLYERYDTDHMTEEEVRRVMNPASVNLLCFDSLEAATGFITTSLSDVIDQSTEIQDKVIENVNHENETFSELNTQNLTSNQVTQDEKRSDELTNESLHESISSLESILSSLFIYEHNLEQRNLTPGDEAKIISGGCQLLSSSLTVKQDIIDDNLRELTVKQDIIDDNLRESTSTTIKHEVIVDRGMVLHSSTVELDVPVVDLSCWEDNRNELQVKVLQDLGEDKAVLSAPCDMHSNTATLRNSQHKYVSAFLMLFILFLFK